MYDMSDYPEFVNFRVGAGCLDQHDFKGLKNLRACLKTMISKRRFRGMMPVASYKEQTFEHQTSSFKRSLLEVL